MANVLFTFHLYSFALFLSSFLSACLPAYDFSFQSVCLSVRFLSVCLPVRPSVCLSLCEPLCVPALTVTCPPLLRFGDEVLDLKAPRCQVQLPSFPLVTISLPPISPTLLVKSRNCHWKREPMTTSQVELSRGSMPLEPPALPRLTRSRCPPVTRKTLQLSLKI